MSNEENLKALDDAMSEHGPKPWDDLSVEEKIERMRQEVKNTQRQVSRLLSLSQQFHSHRHDPKTGEPLVPSRGHGMGEVGGSTLRGYF